MSRDDVRKAMEAHPRWRFTDPNAIQERAKAVKDRPVPIGDGQTISAPHMVAILIEESLVSKGERCLEVGAGSGWLAAVLGEVVGPRGHVTGVEIKPQLVELARSNLQAEGLENVTLLHGDGSLGHPEGGPYDVIIASCGAPSVPDPLLDQLGIGGRLVIPVGHRTHQQLHRVTRTKDGFEEEQLGGCAFVPLVGEHGF